VHCGCSGLIIVHTILLSVALCNILDLVSGNEPIAVAFTFVDQLALEGPLS
jgi:hypothetical protein